MFSYEFISRAVLAGSLISLCASLLGVTLVLKRFSMIGDGLSHVSFGALSIAAVMGIAPLALAVPVVALSAFGLLLISSSEKIDGDAAIGVISGTSLAVGVLAVSFSSGVNIDLSSYMFGSILAMSGSDITVTAIFSAVVLITFVLFYNRIFAVTFDANFAKATGAHTGFLNALIAVLTAVMIVIGMRMMGALLISSLIIFPALTAMRLFKSFRGVTVCAVVVSLCCFLCGITLSYILSAPTGASIVAVNFIVFIIFCIAGRLKKLFQH